MNNDREIINRIRQDMAIELPENILMNDVIILLAAYINDLIQTDFNKLVTILYRLDVSESKLRNLLDKNSGKDAAYIIADLIVERQLQKIKSRQQFRQRDNDIDENEKW
jgi:hypothetical protein